MTQGFIRPYRNLGRLLKIRAFGPGDSGTYTPTAGTNYAIIKMVGGGGGGGAATNDNTVGGGGCAGGFVIAYWSGVTSQSITIGTGGGGGVGADGTVGNASFLGSLITCNGGSGGLLNGATAVSLPLGGTVTTSGVTVLASFRGQSGFMGGPTATGGLIGASGYGASTYFGSGGARGDAAASGDGGNGAATGGGGGYRTTAVSRTGAAGSEGRILIYEYT